MVQSFGATGESKVEELCLLRDDGQRESCTILPDRLHIRTLADEHLSELEFADVLLPGGANCVAAVGRLELEPPRRRPVEECRLVCLVLTSAPATMSISVISKFDLPAVIPFRVLRSHALKLLHGRSVARNAKERFQYVARKHGPPVALFPAQLPLGQDACLESRPTTLFRTAREPAYDKQLMHA